MIGRLHGVLCIRADVRRTSALITESQSWLRVDASANPLRLRCSVDSQIDLSDASLNVDIDGDL